MSDEIQIGDKVTHLKNALGALGWHRVMGHGAGTVLQVGAETAVVLFEEGGVVTVGLRSLTRQAPLPSLDELVV